MERRKLVVMFLTVTMIVSGCYPYEPIYGDESDVVATMRDPEFDFQTLNTFALPDVIVKMTGNLEEGEEPEFIQEEYATVILERIRQNMTDAGWTEVDAEDADVIILPTAMQSTETIWYYERSEERRVG